MDPVLLGPALVDLADRGTQISARFVDIEHCHKPLPFAATLIECIRFRGLRTQGRGLRWRGAAGWNRVQGSNCRPPALAQCGQLSYAAALPCKSEASDSPGSQLVKMARQGREFGKRVHRNVRAPRTAVLGLLFDGKEADPVVILRMRIPHD